MKNNMYSYVFRGFLTQEALDKTDAIHRFGSDDSLDEDVLQRLSLELLDPELVTRAKRMATVYTAIAALENSARLFVSKTMLDACGEGWWSKCVSDRIRSKAENRQNDEAKIRWHTPRGDQPLNYTDFGEISSIIIQNWDHFEPHLQSQDWVKQLLKTLERSRNVIMHSGELANEDIERVGSCIRDWVRQMGT